MTYTVGEIAKKLNVAPSTLRYYDKEGLLPFVERSAGGIRVFHDEDMDWLELIECMKHTGMPIKEIKHFIDELSEYIAHKNHYSQYIAYVQAEGMVTIVFTTGASALDMSKAEREQLKARLILQLRMLAKGAKYETRDKYKPG